MWFKVIVVMVIIMNTKSYKRPSANTFMNTDIYRQCPGLYERVFTDSVPKANLSAGVYTVYGSNSRPISLRECVLACCFMEKGDADEQEECNVALLTKTGACYHVACGSNELCLPQQQSLEDDGVRTSMVLVRPVDRNGPSWTDILRKYKKGLDQERFHDAFDSLWRMSDSDDMGMPNRLLYSNDAPGLVDHSNTEPSMSFTETVTDNMSAPQIIQQLHVIVDSKQVQLPENNVTLEAHVISNAAAEEVEELASPYQYEWITLQQPDAEVMKGVSGAIRNQQDNRLILSHLSRGLYMFNLTVTNGKSALGWTLANVTVLGAVRVNAPPTIIIMPTNQTVRLPNTAAILDASATTDDADVTGDQVQYHWELQQGPLGYQPTLPNTATLQLTDLTRVGQYMFQVSAVDTDGAQSKAVAYVMVLPPTDYPPTADVGPDQVLYLPLNDSHLSQTCIYLDGELVLSGNGSSDDHEIVSWEWTRVNSVDSAGANTSGNADTNMQAVDMRDTRTAMLRLGRIIEPGVYTFQLRVEDASNQTSTAQVRLFVKEKDVQTVRPLAIIAGNGTVTLSAGQTWLLLDGSYSNVTDDNNGGDDSNSGGVLDHVLYYRWDLVVNSTDNNQTVAILNPQAAITNVTGLTKAGLYQFRLQVTLTNSSSSTAVVNVVTVAQTRNTAPRAVATIADSNVQLPRNVIYLNASQSTDDVMIVSYMWRPCTAENTTTAATLGCGAIAEGTDKHPVLVLILVGVRNAPQSVRACWNVTVCDAGGLCDWAAVRFNVLPDAMLEYMVEVVVGGGSTSVTVTEYNALLKSIESSVDDDSIQIHVRPTIGGNIAMPGYSLITLYATTTTVNSNDTSPTTIILTAAHLASLLQRTLVAPLMQQQLQLTAVRPASCLSVTCSGHGQCDPETRTCHCQSFWMPNVLSHVSDGWSGWNRDCSWSVLYVTLASVALVSLVLCLVYVVWTVLCSKIMGGGGGAVTMQSTQQKQRYQHHRRRVRNSHSYTLIDNALVGGRGGGAKRHQRNLADSDTEDQADSGDSDRDDNVVFSSLNDKLPLT